MVSYLEEDVDAGTSSVEHDSNRKQISARVRGLPGLAGKLRQILTKVQNLAISGLGISLLASSSLRSHGLDRGLARRAAASIRRLADTQRSPLHSYSGGAVVSSGHRANRVLLSNCPGSFRQIFR